MCVSVYTSKCGVCECVSEGRNCVCECVNVYGYVAVFVSISECGLCICDYVGV